MSAAGPDLLPIDDEYIALKLGPSRHAGQVRSRTRLAKPLRPLHLAPSDTLQVKPSLLLRPDLHDRRTNDADAHEVHARRVMIGHLLHEHRLAQRRSVLPAVGLRPSHRQPASVGQLLAHLRLERVGLGVITAFAHAGHGSGATFRDLRFQERAELVTKGYFLWGKLKIHTLSLPVSLCV